MYERILVPTDGSDVAEAAVDHALDIARKYDAEIHALFVADTDAIGPIARPEEVVFTPELPKTRSGKIMRRLLENIANGEELGNTSTLRNPEVVHDIQAKVDGE